MFCGNCGNKLAEGARFCGVCGTPVDQWTAPAGASDPVDEAFHAPAHAAPAAHGDGLDWVDESPDVTAALDSLAPDASATVVIQGSAAGGYSPDAFQPADSGYGDAGYGDARYAEPVRYEPARPADETMVIPPVGSAASAPRPSEGSSRKTKIIIAVAVVVAAVAVAFAVWFALGNQGQPGGGTSGSPVATASGDESSDDAAAAKEKAEAEKAQAEKEKAEAEKAKAEAEKAKEEAEKAKKEQEQAEKEKAEAEKEKAEAEKQSAQPSGDYILPDSASRYYTRAEIERLSTSDLKYARNEIYARHGRKFNDPALQSYFDAKSWYTPRYSPEEFENMPSPLNDYEIKNAELMLDVEKSR